MCLRGKLTFELLVHIKAKDKVSMIGEGISCEIVFIFIIVMSCHPDCLSSGNCCSHGWIRVIFQSRSVNVLYFNSKKTTKYFMN